MQKKARRRRKFFTLFSLFFSYNKMLILLFFFAINPSESLHTPITQIAETFFNPTLYISTAENMYTSQLFIPITCQRTIECVVAMRTKQRDSISKTRDYRRMIKIPRCPAKLNKIPYLNLRQAHFFRVRPAPIPYTSRISYQEIVKIFHARPRWRTVIQRDIVPSERRGIVHYAGCGVDALRDKVGAVTPYSAKISEYRVLPEGIFFGISYSSFS